MLNLLWSCLADKHDPALLVLAAVVCSAGCYSTFAMGRQMFRAPSKRAQLIWATTGILTTSSAIWATHFVGMLAFDPGVAAGFDVPLTIASFAFAFGLVSAATGLLYSYPGWFGHIAGGSVIGLAIASMHYTGMLAYRVHGELHWDATIVLISIVIGIVLSATSMGMALSRWTTIRASAPVVLVLAVCGAHFFGMTAVTIDVDPRIAVPPQSADFKILSIVVANVVLLIIGLSILALRLSLRDHRNAKAEKQRFRDLADIAVEGLLICDGDVIVGANRSLERLFSGSRDALVGRDLAFLIPGLKAKSVPLDAERDMLLHDGSNGMIPVRVIGQTMRIDRKSHTVIAVRDQRERLRSEEKMLRLAHNDVLTGLANRLRFGEAIDATYASGRPSRQPFALLTLDLDRFKAVNDTHGHGMGDQLLKRAAGRLQRIVGHDDLLARMGGDEFVILRHDASDQQQVRVLAENMVELLSRPFLISGNIVEVSASVGIAFGPNDGSTAAELLQSADLALYKAKADGRGTYRMFEPEMDARMRVRRTLEMDLRRAIAREEFEVHYQPQVDSRTGAFDGAEALVRWRHPERGLISPAEFIPLAEETGLIGAVGEIVLRLACAEAMQWPSHLVVAVNLSSAQFLDARLSATISTVLAETALPGHRLELEITESLILQDDGRTLETLHELKRLGIRISMDDFGTGYSSLSYLRKFPFDKIKIDQSFVRQVPHDLESASILRAIMALGTSLGMRTTAEGVETSEQRTFVTGEGCDQIQGYLISRPVPSDEIRAVFAEARSVSAAA